MVSESIRARGADRLIPLIRAEVARRLSDRGFRVKEIARALDISSAAVTQYLKGRRGKEPWRIEDASTIIEDLADRAAQRLRSGGGALNVVELVDAAYNILAASAGQEVLGERGRVPANREWVNALRERLRLELTAAQKCLELANRSEDDYTKLLLRMVATDSIRHADIVSQLITWLEGGVAPPFKPPDSRLVKEILLMEDRASEQRLSDTIPVPNPLARLLLESIDIDEEKHDRILSRIYELLHGEG